MSSSNQAADARGRNDPYGWIDGAAAELLSAANELAAKSEGSRVSDAAVAQLMTGSDPALCRQDRR